MAHKDRPLRGAPVDAYLRAHLRRVKKETAVISWQDEDWRRAPFLIFDTETTSDAAQTLNFGFYQVGRFAKDGAFEVVDEGVFHADDLGSRDPDGYRCLVRESERQGLDLQARAAFIDDVFFPICYDARGICVGFNLPFDLSRLAVRWSTARGRNRDAFSFSFSDYLDLKTSQRREDKYCPRLSIRKLDSTRSFFRFLRPRDIARDHLIPPGESEPDKRYRFRGRFSDLRTLSHGLTGQKHTLQSAAVAFGLEGKFPVVEHGSITPKYIAYARQDVNATRDLLVQLLAELDQLPVDTQPDRVYSPATLGKGFLHSLGLVPLLKHLDPPDELLGKAMAADAKEHGLGHLMNPINPKTDDRDWIRQVWQYLVDREEGLEPERPDWFDHPAVSRWSVSTPRILSAFRQADPSATGNVRPFNFLCSAQIAPMGNPVGVDPKRCHLFAPYEADPGKWLDLPWVDSYSGRRVPVTTSFPGPPEVACLITYGDLIERFARHPEPKSAGPDGRPCDRQTRGPLQRRHLEIKGFEYVGKESNRLEAVETGVLHDAKEAVQHYGGTEGLWEWTLAQMHRFTADELGRTGGVSVRYVKMIRNRRRKPSGDVKERLIRWVVRRL